MIKSFNSEELKHIDPFIEIFNNMSELVFMTKVENGRDFHYVFANEPAKNFVGLTDESFGKPISDFHSYEACKLIEANYLKAIVKKKAVTYEDKVIVTPNLTRLETDKYSTNQVVYWETIITPIFNHDGVCTHLIGVVRDITDRKMKEKELKRVKNRLELVWNSTADAMYTFGIDESFVDVNAAFEKLLGWTEEEILNDPTISIIPKDSNEDLRGIMEKVKKGEVVPSQEVQRIAKNGDLIEVLASYSPIYDYDGDWNGGVVVYKDITEQNRIYQELVKSEENYRIIADHSSDLIKVVDIEGIVQYASPSHMTILGVYPDYYLNKSILSFCHSDDMYVIQHALKGIAQSKEAASIEYRRLMKNGEWIWVHAIGTPIFDENGDVARVIFEARDITERKEYEEKLKHLALHDHLTGLPNRMYFSERLRVEIEQAKRQQTILSAMILDLDKFKNINDTMGHDVGDELLKEFAIRVSNCLGEQDIMARLGGDEFAILLPGLNDKKEAMIVAEKIIQSLQNEWLINNHCFKTTSSIGISFYPPYDQEDKLLLKNADLALYQAKEKGRNNYQVVE
jgi:diguanylate cyclase (GGDEF)-like protein/PAS domain S-box-containing protein